MTLNSQTLGSSSVSGAPEAGVTRSAARVSNERNVDALEVIIRPSPSGFCVTLSSGRPARSGATYGVCFNGGTASSQLEYACTQRGKCVLQWRHRIF